MAFKRAAAPCDVLATLAYLHFPGDVFEIRLPKSGKLRTVSGYFNDYQQAADELARYADNPEVPAYYVTLNPVLPDLYARTGGRLERNAENTTADEHILCRTALLIDLDPVRPSGISSTDEEKRASRESAAAVLTYLRDEHGFPDPLVGDSGNGSHLLYKIALANDAESTALIKNFLEGLARKFSADAIKIDTSVFNAGRITKVFGTPARKGANVPERPHRVAKILSLPATIEIVTAAMLESVIAALPAPAAARRNHGAPRAGGIVLRDWLTQVGLIDRVQVPRPWNGDGEKYEFVGFCPFSDAHADGAFVAQYDNGALTASCRHESCKGNDWHALRAKYEPAAPSSSSRKPSQATQLVLLGRQAELFHDGDNCFATVRVDNHIETYSLANKSFKRWLGQQFFVANGAAASGDAIGAAINTLCGFAQTKEDTPFVRIGGCRGKIYLDLCNPTWQVVEVDGAGWRVIEAACCPIRFHRRHGLRALPAPVTGGSLQELRELVNIPAENEWKMYVGWLVAALRDHGPYPILFVIGPAGSGKGSIALFGRKLIDPNLATLRHPPRNDRDFMIAASNSWMTCLNNVSFISDWLSDCLCCLSTGGGHAARTLYENDEESLFDVQRPALVNSIVHAIRHGDLLDRALIISPQKIDDDKRRPEDKLYAAYEAARPRILGALLDAVSCAIRRLPEINLPKLPRMADFAVWVEAAAPALDWQPGEFLEAYASERNAANDLVLEGAVAQAIIVLPKPWEGTATALLETLNEQVTEQVRRGRRWPVDGQRLANELRRLSPNLLTAEIDVSFSEGRKHGRRIKITDAQEDARGDAKGDAKKGSAPPFRSKKARQTSGFSDTGDAEDGGDAGMHTFGMASSGSNGTPRKKFGK